MCDREKRHAMKRDLLEAGVGVEDAVEEQVAAFVCAKPDRRPGQKTAKR